MKLAIVGSTGFVGSSLTQYLHDTLKAEGFAGYNKNKPLNLPNSFFIDITNKDQRESIVKSIHPDIILHLAAQANVDQSEQYPELANALNYVGTKNITEIASKHNIRLIMMSTDYVFAGDRDVSYIETSPTKGVNIEGHSKEMAEKVLLETQPLDWAIIRISVPYGWRTHENQKSFFDWVIANLQNNKKINVVNDQYSCPTSLLELGPLIETIIVKHGKSIFHGVGKDYLSRYEFVLQIAQVFNLDKDLIHSITTEELKKLVPSYKAPRPLYCHLLDTRTEKEFGFSKYSVTENLIKLREQKKR